MATEVWPPADCLVPIKAKPLATQGFSRRDTSHMIQLLIIDNVNMSFSYFVKLLWPIHPVVETPQSQLLNRMTYHQKTMCVWSRAWAERHSPADLWPVASAAAAACRIVVRVRASAAAPSAPAPPSSAGPGSALLAAQAPAVSTQNTPRGGKSEAVATGFRVLRISASLLFLQLNGSHDTMNSGFWN